MSVQTVVRSLFTSLHERITLMEEILLRQMDSAQNTNDGTIEKSLQITRVDPAFLERLAALEAGQDTIRIGYLKVIESLKEDVNRLKRDIVRIDASHVAVVPSAEEVQQEIAKREVETAPEVAEAEAADLDCDEEEEEVVEEEEEEEENDNGLIPLTYQGLQGKYYRDTDNDVFVELPESWKQVGHWNPLTKTITFDEEEAEEEVEEEGEEEEEVEEEAVELSEFTYKGHTYYHDAELKVYAADEDGAVDPSMPIGRWNPTSGKITRLT